MKKTEKIKFNMAKKLMFFSLRKLEFSTKNNDFYSFFDDISSKPNKNNFSF